MDRGELLWEALWLTTHSPRGDHEALWAPCWKPSMASGSDFRASLLCMRQLQLCCSAPWLAFGDRLASSALLSQQRRFFHCHLEAAAQQIPRQPSLQLQMSDLQNKTSPESCCGWGS